MGHQRYNPPQNIDLKHDGFQRKSPKSLGAEKPLHFFRCKNVILFGGYQASAAHESPSAARVLTAVEKVLDEWLVRSPSLKEP